MPRPATADATLVADVRARLGAAARDGDRADVGSHVRDALRSRGAVLGSRALEQVVADVRAHVLGAGPLQPFLDDPAVTDVLVNGPGDVWVDRGAGLEPVDVDLGGAASLRELAVRLAAAGGQRLDDASPLVDARLPDGTRLHAVIEPVCTSGAVISLRVLRSAVLGVDALDASGAFPAGARQTLEALVRARANVLVSGATGTGKTTLLAALLALVPAEQRIVCIEEARELAPAHPHVVHLTARQANVEDAGEVTLSALVRAALRMRPDRIVLGECRGPEVRDMLLALNTGHEGGWATVHANSPGDVPARLDALAGLAGMTSASMAAQAASALDAVVHLQRRGRRRQVAGIGAVVRDGDRLVVQDALAWDERGETVRGPGWERLAERVGLLEPGVTPAHDGPAHGGPARAWPSPGLTVSQLRAGLA